MSLILPRKIIEGGAQSRGLVGFWPLFDGYRSTAKDFTRSANSGALINSPTWALGRGNNQALQFTSVSQTYVETTYAIPLNDFTICCWFNSPTGTSGSYQRIVDCSYTSGFWIGHNSGSADQWGGGCLGSFNFLTVPNPNTWHHLCMTRAGASVSLFLDGGAVTRTDIISSAATGTEKLRIGHSNYLSSNAPDAYDGKIADVRLYNRAISVDELQRIYYRGGDIFEYPANRLWAAPATPPPTGSTNFRSTLSALGTRSGSRQAHR